MIKKAIFILLLVCILSNPIVATTQISENKISNPQKISEMQIQITQHGIIDINGDVSKLILNLSIPQNTENQIINSIQTTHNYEIITDKYNNQIMKLVFNNPSNKIDFTVKTDITIKRRTKYPARFNKGYLLPTRLVESDSLEISKLANDFKESNDIYKIFKIAKWVNKYITYDESYVSVNLSATNILNKKKGTCDEYSVLFLSLIRNMGYASSYVAGYAYSKDRFIPHGWAEVYYNDYTIDVDPTWGEAGFLDATHIKFANLPDAVYSEAAFTAEGYNNFDVTIKNLDTNIKIISFKEDSLVSMKSSLLEDEISNGYAVVKNDFYYDGCILLKITNQGCTYDSKEFVTPINKDQLIYFCNNKTLFSIFSLPDTERYSYVCPLNIINYAGNDNVINVKIYPKKEQSVSLSIDKSTITPNEKYIVKAPNCHIFTDYGDYAFGYGEFLAGYDNFNVYAYNKGYLQSQQIKVIDSTPIELILETKNKYYLNSPVLFN
ncbi:MAG: transglutaminase domain-containing protein, partial [Candidatus Aenigmarchaeota archaeon]|nr:transglutaminase domain-containing protein [Candidatus Aenigmarchaeota archaeon]